jgi:TrmH family RNA methyltransferase
VFVAPGGEDDPVVARAAGAGVRVSRLAPGVLERVAGTVTPQPLLAIAPWCDVPLDAVLEATFVVVCIDLRDPGNAGTVLRSAEGAGAEAVVLCDGSVEAFNPKTVRASAGSLFHVPVVQGGAPEEVLDRLGAAGLRRLGAAAAGGVPHTATDLTRPLALVLGNEAAGLPPGLAERLDGLVTVPLVGRSESLNVGMAAAVLCFEVARQRTATGSPGSAVVGDTGRS